MFPLAVTRDITIVVSSFAPTWLATMRCSPAPELPAGVVTVKAPHHSFLRLEESVEQEVAVIGTTHTLHKET